MQVKSFIIVSNITALNMKIVVYTLSKKIICRIIKCLIKFYNTHVKEMITLVNFLDIVNASDDVLLIIWH